MKGVTHSGGYSEAIPIDEIVGMAKADIDRCKARTDEEIQRCAEKVVREKLCPCAASVDRIVAMVVEEYRRQLGAEGNT